MSRFAQTILAATDFSDASHLALEAAGIVARQNEAKLTLVHVLVADGTVPLIEDPTSGLAMADDETRARLHSELHALAAQKLPGLEVKVAVVVSRSAADGLCHYAEHVDADLIVLATHGRSGIARMLIGSVAERVVRHAPCPVLTLRSKAKS